MTTRTRERRLWWRHLLSVLAFPFTMTVVIPSLIVFSDGRRALHLSAPALAAAGGLLIAVGMGLLIWTVVLFDRVGKGTLGVGATMGEPVNLVVRGPYRHVRNPMISGVMFILSGEAAIAGSGPLFWWFAGFLAVQLVFIRFWEEPHLEHRYGSQYADYRRNVPRWVPRMSAWR